MPVFPQYGFDVAMDKNGNIGLDPRRPLQFRALVGVDFRHDIARYLRFKRQKFDFGFGIGRPNEILLAQCQGVIVHKMNSTNDAIPWLFCT
jgi:hypothetical protein